MVSLFELKEKRLIPHSTHLSPSPSYHPPYPPLYHPRPSYHPPSSSYPPPSFVSQDNRKEIGGWLVVQYI